ANRLSADERLNDEFVRMKRTEAGYAVLMMDIDFFKRVNDTYGHAVGDEVLKHVGRILKATVRESDFVARYGGEEFLAILPATRFEDACQVAGKIQQAIGANPMLPVGSITISVGLALASPAQLDHNEVVHQADDWLYEAKRSGRNRVAGSGIRWTEGRLTVRNNHPVAPDA
ncbi:MAG: GGDEF domain-containing protein, partial [Gammaproteobacteria bacterium]|nr:GGDEF domain-containing protein [Gammaproteobacteria bacterium]